MRVTMPYIGKALSVNYYKVMGKGGRRTNKTRPEVEIWMQQLADAVKELAPPEMFGHPVIVSLWGEFRDERCPDLHNLHKVIADALESALGINDRYVKFEDAGYVAGVGNPKLVMDIEVV